MEKSRSENGKNQIDQMPMLIKLQKKVNIKWTIFPVHYNVHFYSFK